VIEAQLERRDGGLTAVAGSHRIALGDETLSQRPGLRAYEGRQVILGIRPEDLEDAALVSDSDPDKRIRGKVLLREALGSEIMVHFSVDAKAAVTEETQELAKDVGAEGLGEGGPLAEGGTMMVGRFGARSRVKEGDETEVAVDTRALHFFDPETGLGVYDQTDSTKGPGS
jgi:multiple sugar transport system ATP-binding protein